MDAATLLQAIGWAIAIVIVAVILSFAFEKVTRVIMTLEAIESHLAEIKLSIRNHKLNGDDL
jgi:hypothetical protein